MTNVNLSRSRQRKASPRTARKAVDVQQTGEARRFEHDNQAVTFVPLQIKRRRMRRLLVPPPDMQTTPEGMSQSNIDVPMLKTLGKAFYWQRLIDEGVLNTSSEIAARFKVDRGWVSEVMRLTCLAPDIVEAILSGRQPRQLNLQQLRRGVPVAWQEQRRLFGFIAAEQDD